MDQSLSVNSPVAVPSVQQESFIANEHPGNPGTASQEASRSVRAYSVFGKKTDGPSRRLPGHSGGMALESIIGSDDRKRILDTDLAPWRMICALRIKGAGSSALGTGWLAGPKTIITAGHCVYHPNLGGNNWAQEITVLPGLNGDEQPKLGSLTSGQPIKVRQFSAHRNWASDKLDGDFDIGCIHLEDALGDEVGWFAIASLPPHELQDYQVNVAGYPADRGGGRELYHHANKITKVTDRRVHYEVDTFGGQSGSPAWIQKDAFSAPLAIGIHAYGVSNGFTDNSAPRIDDEVFKLITGWISQGHQTKVTS